MAGTWINLQDAYVVESNNLGDWNQIGYSAPGTKQSSATYITENFKYEDKSFSVAKATWQATAQKNLNDCTAAATSVWTLEAVPNKTGEQTYIEFKADGDPKCTGLTPSFAKLTRTGNQ